MSHFPNYGAPDLRLVRGVGSTVWDDAGLSYTDLLAGIAVNVLGHAHPQWVAAVQQQASLLAHVSNLYRNDPADRLVERLGDGGRSVFLCNSGTEANEAALKLIRRARGEGIVLAFEKGFHGRTAGALALTGQPQYQAGCGPLPSGIVHVPFNDEGALQAAFEQYPVVGVFAEVIQGEGGVIPMTDGFATALQQEVDAADALLVVDEVQTGIGRTGTLWAYEQTPLRPDIITTAKGLGGGLPIGAMIADDALAEHLGPGSHGSTFGGNPIACAGAHVVLDALDDAFLANVRALGERIAAVFPDARGRGLLWGIDVPDAAAAVMACREDGVLVGQAGPNTLRLAPPLNIESTTLDAALTVVAEQILVTA